ncbi:MAG TPA: SDR family NAD(P)-dependent oxidoreductase [Acidimicrobiales bacterium]
MTGTRLEGKLAVVVGAGQTRGATLGNGRAVALRFAQEGAHVVLVDRDATSVQETHAMVVAEGGRADVVVADVTSAAHCDLVVREAIGLGGAGRVDVLHHNVGIAMGDGSPTRVTEDGWDRIIDVNLKATWLMCRAVVPSMREAGAGSIVCVSSVAAIAAATNLTAYKVSKAGVNALVQSLAMSNARFGIRVNGIMPGLIDTPMAVDAVARAVGRPREEVADVRAAQVPLGRQGSAWDVANAALFLASDEAAFVTGVVLPVDGGQSARVG